MSSRFLILLATVLFSGCAALPAPAPMGAPPILRTTPVAPEATTIMRCLGERLGRHRAGLPPLLVAVESVAYQFILPPAPTDIPRDQQVLVAQLLAEVGPAVAFAVGGKPGLRPDLSLRGDAGFPETSTHSAGWQAAAFARNEDGSGNRGDQVAVSGLHLSLVATAPEGVGHHGWGGQLQVQFLRTNTTDRSIAVSIAGGMLGYNDVQKTVHSHGHAVRLGWSILLASTLARTQGVPLAGCHETFTAAGDVEGLKDKVLEFRNLVDSEPAAAAAALNRLRVLQGQPPRERSALQPVGAATLPDDPAAARLLKEKFVRGPLESEFAARWATLHRTPRETVDAGAALIRKATASEGAESPGKARPPPPPAKRPPPGLSHARCTKAAPGRCAAKPAQPGKLAGRGQSRRG